MYHSEYFGCIISKKDSFGYSLKWESYVNGSFVYADTLSGIKQMIRERK